MKFRNLPVVITFFMVVCVLAIIGASVFRSWEAEMPSPMPLVLTELEYSSDGSITWDPVGADSATMWLFADTSTSISRTDGS